MKPIRLSISEPSSSRSALYGFAVLWILLVLSGRLHASNESDWLAKVREQVAAHDLSGAAETVNARIEAQPADLEAQTWRARILSWTENLNAAEDLYREVLLQAPNDADVLIGLADVLFWEGKLKESSDVLESAERLRPASPEVEQRRERNTRTLYAQNSSRNSQNSASAQVESDIYRYSLRITSESDLFNYSSAAQNQSIDLGITWNSRWSSQLLATSYRRFSDSAEQWSTGIAYRFSANQSVAASFAVANHQQIFPVRQAAFDYDHGIRFRGGALKGIEFVAHSAGVWFDGSAVTVLGGSAIVYLPRDWMCTFAGNAARTKFDALGASWAPSFSAKVSAPVFPRMRGNIGFGSGAENYSSLEQIGQISARTYLGGLQYSLSKAQDFSGFIAYQQRSHGVVEINVGGGYGFRF